MGNKTEDKEKNYIRSDGWVFSKEGLKRLKEGGMKGHLLVEESIKKQIGNRHRIIRPLDRNAVDILKSVKGMIPRAVFLSNAIMAAVEREEVA